MALYWIRGCLFSLILCQLLCCYSLGGASGSGSSPPPNTFTVSSFSYPQSKLRPYDLRYIRVDLPPWFSSVSIELESDVDLDMESLGQVSNSMLPMVCFRDGSPPLPDVSNSSLKSLAFSMPSNESLKRIQGLQNAEQCYPMQRNITMKLTNEQISPGIWYFGLFNGLGPARTQSKMIVRRASYSFSANVSVEGCMASMTWGQYCNQTIDSLSCTQSETNSSTDYPLALKNQTQSVLSCKNSFETSCLGSEQIKVYYIDVLEMAEELTFMATDVRLNPAPSNHTGNFSGVNLMYFARHGSIASSAQHDYSSNISSTPLVIQSPMVGRWYVTILPSNFSKQSGQTQVSNATVCFSIKLQVLECPLGKAGPNCLWERHELQTIPRISVPFESYYLPLSGKVSSSSANFLLDPLLSNSSSGGLNDTWTYFVLEIPRGAAGGNIHVRVTSDAKIKFEIYTRFGGLPSLRSWDYYYANKTSSSDGSTFFISNNSTEEKIDFYILNAREGSWVVGIRQPNSTATGSKGDPTMSLSLERCPRKCSSHGDCKTAFDASGLTSYSFCSCDRNHGGFDCSIEIVSHQGHLLQSIFLIASNAAAILPAYWALRQKAFAEWVLFTSSGISSGLYHACDVGTWCALSFGVLQFMDFWLSFMAVVSTFVYLTTISEVHKRAIHTAVAILTALMALTKATRSSNIILVMAIGVMGLLIGWLIELSTKFRTFSFSAGVWLNMLDRWQVIRVWLRNLVKTLMRRFRWGFLIAGFIALIMAGVSWKLETSESYWIWHSLWHVTIYTSSFFFLCSKATVAADGDEERPPYALTRQDSFSRGH
ncbi:uncharacterized protein LOC116203626 isoform X1 [Punica granatum]|uniref:Uncharacterized protein LOC116203626 isoform X1 n=2 Tax=Punica granatum TaxID=22663 RepID=A0A218XTN9_PUNGR|nr:uncharacterized protein LOC116203626 isoform X1 [Punica granatum]OWM88190.1 hypothetical protein CDL15_Pgr003602 [Punica granatum]